MLSAANVLPFHLSRAQYDYCARLLCRFGRVPGVKLKSSEFRVLCFLLGQGPGYFGHQYTVGDALDGMSTDAAHDAIKGLRHKKLLQSESVFEGQPLRRGFAAPTRTCRYYVCHELHGLLSAEERRLAEEARKKQDEAPPAPREPAPDDLSWTEPELQRIAASFDRLELRRPCGTLELQTLRKRLGDGVGLEALMLAVEGARGRRWTRADGSRWAKDPFAIVFASRSSVEKAAREGLAYRNVQPAEAGAIAVQESAVAVGPRLVTPKEPSPMTASTPSSTRSGEIKDSEHYLKITTAGTGDRREDRVALRATNAASETPGSVNASRANAPTAPPSGPPPLRVVASPREPTRNGSAHEPRATNEGEHVPGHHAPPQPPAPRPGAPQAAASSRVLTLAGREVTVSTSAEAARRTQESAQMHGEMQAILAGLTPDFLKPRGPNGERVPPTKRR